MTYRTENDNEIKSIERVMDDAQIAHKRLTGKYRYSKPTRLARGTVEEHEYVGNRNGKEFKGYIRIQKFKDDKGNVIIKSVDKGSGGFSHGWQKVDKFNE